MSNDGCAADLKDILAVLLWSGIPYEIEKKKSTTYVSTDSVRFSFSPNRLQRVYQKKENGHWRVLTEYKGGEVHVLGRLQR